MGKSGAALVNFPLASITCERGKGESDTTVNIKPICSQRGEGKGHEGHEPPKKKKGGGELTLAPLTPLVVETTEDPSSIP